MQDRVSVKTIAEACGYSVPAIYAALNGSGNLSHRTRQKILAVANEMGFRPNLAARAISTGRFDAIGILSGTIQGKSMLPLQMLLSIQEMLKDRNLALSLNLYSHQTSSVEEQIPQMLRTLSVDGLLVHYIVESPQQIFEVMDMHHIPAVWINVDMPKDSVYPDDEAGARIGTEYLIRQGHRRIAYSRIGPDNHYSVSARKNGYLQAMKQAGLQPILWCDPNADKQKKCYEWMTGEDQPTAVLTYELYLALALLWIARDLGRTVPRDLSLLTIHEEVFSMLGPKISTLVIPQYEIGQNAVNVLLNRIESGGKSMPSVKVPLVLVEGDTVCPPPSS